MKGMKKVKIVCNTSPLIFLNSIDKLDLLEKLFSEVYIPNSVYDEIRKKGEKEKILVNINHLLQKGKYRLYVVKNQMAVLSMLGRLHRGEVEVMVSYLELNADFALLDDLLARNKAQSMGINTIGTLGLLLLGFKKGYVNNLMSLIDQLILKGFWISEDVYGKIMETVERLK
ncbi:putative nucleic acid-binding protein [Caldanaerobacter subterraneus]|uniref:Putative nucleic acid-binding protein n=1 Tax=Caldanaerobacter subterraneus TaxID=911092 RepID=A0A4R2JWJ7_9THEO|nr:putative nucleic acid-binding protein [Caldanaerobacter subterraneus]